MATNTLIFDLDDTIYSDVDTAQIAFLQTCELAKERYDINPEELRATVREVCRGFWQKSPGREYSVRIGISSWEGLWASFEGDGDDLKILRDWAPAYRKNSWLESLLRFDIDDQEFAIELGYAFMVNRRKMHVLFDDVPLLLDSLKDKYKLGLLTNGAPDLQRAKIDGAKIDGYFNDIVVSGEVGVGKPDPRIFEIMLQQLGAEPDKAIMVGNSLSNDVKGAQAAGMKAVWLNRSGKNRDDTIVPDWEISGLKELSNILS